MRSSVMVLMLMVTLTGRAFAQESQAAFGVKAGANFANVDFQGDDDTFNFDRRTGLTAGLFVVWPANSRLALQTEALYSQKGITLDEGGASGTTKIDYLDFPVLARFSSSPSGGTSFHLFAGPSFGFRVSAKTEVSVDGEEDFSEDIDEEIERVDLGLVVGAGVEFGRLVVDGRYTWGLSDLDADKSDDIKIRNRVFTVMAGFRF